MCGVLPYLNSQYASEDRRIKSNVRGSECVDVVLVLLGRWPVLQLKLDRRFGMLCLKQTG
jgi:hypothetical protein